MGMNDQHHRVPVLSTWLNSTDTMVAMFNLCDQGTETGILLFNTVTCLMYSTLYLNKTKPKKNPQKNHKKTQKQKRQKNQTIILYKYVF